MAASRSMAASARWERAIARSLTAVAPPRKVLPLRDQLQRLARVRASDVPIWPLPDEMAPSDPHFADSRFIRQRQSDGALNVRWLESRRGLLTGSQFASALGLKGISRKVGLYEHLRNSLQSDGLLQPYDPVSDHEGSRWGTDHERDAVATYVSAWLQTRCPGAAVRETGFWPIPGHENLGVSPDGLVEGTDGVIPGGATLEVKCPFRGGAVDGPHERVDPHSMPQLQGAMLATGRAECHLVSWTPYGAKVFVVKSSPAFQEEMLSGLDLFVHNARQGAPLPSLSSAAQRTATHAIRNHCRHLSDTSQLVATIDARDCITVV